MVHLNCCLSRQERVRIWRCLFIKLQKLDPGPLRRQHGQVHHCGLSACRGTRNCCALYSPVSGVLAGGMKNKWPSNKAYRAVVQAALNIPPVPDCNKTTSKNLSKMEGMPYRWDQKYHNKGIPWCWLQMHIKRLYTYVMNAQLPLLDSVWSCMQTKSLAANSTFTFEPYYGSRLFTEWLLDPSFLLKFCPYSPALEQIAGRG